MSSEAQLVSYTDTEGSPASLDQCTASDAHQTPVTEPDWIEERFRVDRKKLEEMLQMPADGSGQNVEEFFQKVMDETNTQIKWPSKLKIGAKSKKDPHVKVEGKIQHVAEAKKRILAILETKVNKVTLKMDVPHTEHSHVIGKGGSNIKKVMEDTGCHIHFPDSNRCNGTEKSNQVSLAGPASGVESARKQIRDLQPLVLMFDIPITTATVPDINAPIIQHIMQSFGVAVSFKHHSKFPLATCIVKGLHGKASAVKKATLLLIELLVGSDTSVTVTTHLDVGTQQYHILLSQNGANILKIMQASQAQIVFPDLNGLQNQNTLLLQGNVESVCTAKQQLTDCLPLCLMFDMKESEELEPEKMSTLVEKLGVFISMKSKPKQSAKSVIVKGLERNVLQIYEARKLLLGLECSALGPTPGIVPLNGISNHWITAYLQQLAHTEPGHALLNSALKALIGQSSQIPQSTRGNPSSSYLNLVMNTGAEKPRAASASLDANSSTVLKAAQPPPGINMVQKLKEELPSARNSTASLQATEDFANMSLEDRLSSDNLPALDKTEVIKGSTVIPGSASEISRAQSQEKNSDFLKSNTALLPNFNKESERSNVGQNEGKQESGCQSSCNKTVDCDYEKKKLLATKAMQKRPVVTEVRTPTDTWSGLGFSKSMPAKAAEEIRNVNRRNYKSYYDNNTEPSFMEQSLNGSDCADWRKRRESTASSFPTFSSSARRISDLPCNTFLSCSNYLESISSQNDSKMWKKSILDMEADDLPELFSSLGLSKYIDIFQEQEIDFQMFLTLTDEDLKELGISTFGARRKMLLAISDLNKNARKLMDLPTVRAGYLDGGASGRLPRADSSNIASSSNRW
ncbi:protein bicaudal C homolog 1-like isoform X2 [Protopterus annectens]|uniref:protein bicaudal C homolog 1-like isoform X2 n=1 Tax=Protopterus annectens TaxID=7888 RepID=UPI001CF931FF|nr:protein bicaudal C homolog 1-like isoform X2 [Protopterus annectens]